MTALRLCDSHCHLDFSDFDPIRKTLLEQCWAQGLRAIVIPGVEADHWSRVLQLCQLSEGVAETPRLLPALGLHPCFIDRHQVEHLTMLEQQLRHDSVVALGEIGLDLWQPEPDINAQLSWLEPQLDLAQQFKLPVLLHARRCHDQLAALLRKRGFSQGGIVHAFSGSRQQAERYLELGFKLGVGGAITYPRATKLKQTAQALGVEHWVLETDAPDMPMQGRQGQINRPDYLPQVLQSLEPLFELSREALAEQLWCNTQAVLGQLMEEGRR